MPDKLPLFEIHLRRRRRSCRWYLITTAGDAVMQGSERTPAAARYQANRALFLMLLASAYRPSERGNAPSGEGLRPVVNAEQELSANLRGLMERLRRPEE